MSTALKSGVAGVVGDANGKSGGAKSGGANSVVGDANVKSGGVKREQRMVSVGCLVHAPWNPRTEEELNVDHPEMVKLVASVREMGVVQPIAVLDHAGWLRTHTHPLADFGGKDGNKKSPIVIAGNRRFEAAKAAGLKEIPAIVFDGITEVQAREITRIENEVRLGVSPIADAALVGSMMDLGYDQKKIAAHFGVSEATICRRAKLLNLTGAIREMASDGKIATDALEHMAAFSADTQNACFKNVKSYCARDGIVHWSDLRWAFSAHAKDLDAAPFDTACCEGCADSTAAQNELFPDMVDKHSKKGACLNAKCWKRHVRAALVERVKKMVKDKGIEIVEFETLGIDAWKVERYPNVFSEKAGKKWRAAYWTWDRYSNTIKILYGLSPKVALEAVARIEDEIAEKEKARKKQEAMESAKRDAITKAREAIDEMREPLKSEFERAMEPINEAFEEFECLGEEIEKYVGGDRFVADALAEACTDWGFKRKYPDAYLTLLWRFGGLRRTLGIELKDKTAARNAWNALAEFDRKNPKPEYEEQDA